MKNVMERPVGGSKEIDLEDIISAIEKMEGLPENQRINPEDFKNVKKLVAGKETDLFSLSEIEVDQNKVEEKRARILSQRENLPGGQKNANAVANFVEVAVPEAIRKLGWLGDKIKVIRPSLYDDYFRGIDNVIQMLPEEVIEGEEDLRCIGFSIDFTISEDEAKNKVFGIMLEIARGGIPSIKYFSADIMTKDGPKSLMLKEFKIPKIVMSCPHKILSKSEEDLLSFENNPDDAGAKNKAEETPLRYYFIRESLSQLRFLTDLAGRMGNKEAKGVYQKSLDSFMKILEDMGIDEDTLNKKIGKISGLINKFNLDAENGQLLQILKEMSKGKG